MSLWLYFRQQAHRTYSQRIYTASKVYEFNSSHTYRHTQALLLLYSVHTAQKERNFSTLGLPLSHLMEAHQLSLDNRLGAFCLKCIPTPCWSQHSVITFLTLFGFLEGNWKQKEIQLLPRHSGNPHHHKMNGSGRCCLNWIQKGGYKRWKKYQIK